MPPPIVPYVSRSNPIQFAGDATCVKCGAVTNKSVIVRTEYLRKNERRICCASKKCGDAAQVELSFYLADQKR